MNSPLRAVVSALGIGVVVATLWTPNVTFAASRATIEETRGQAAAQSTRATKPAKKTKKVARRTAAPSTPVRSASISFDVAANGFSFANWSDLGPSDDATLATLRRLFDDSSVCATVDEGTCTPFAAATTFLARLNVELTKGHCEGLTLAAYSYFAASRTGVSGLSIDEVLADVNYFASTQVLPNAARQTRTSRAEDLAVIAERLLADLTRGGGATLGLHEETRAHTVLPIGIQIVGSRATITVYDSNTPGRAQVVNLDLSANTWTYTPTSADGTVTDSWSGTKNLSVVDLAARASVSTAALRS